MRVRPLTITPPTLDQATETAKNCMEDVENFLAALRARDNCAAGKLRLKISKYAPPGVYAMRSRETPHERHLFVFGVHREDGVTEVEKAFMVSYQSRDADGGLCEFGKMPLLGTDGFLHPLCIDSYRGPRAWIVGEMITP